MADLPKPTLAVPNNLFDSNKSENGEFGCTVWGCCPFCLDHRVPGEGQPQLWRF